jgi:hypothetical protein
VIDDRVADPERVRQDVGLEIEGDDGRVPQQEDQPEDRQGRTGGSGQEGNQPAHGSALRRR